jgi:hypothetical protein
VADFLALFGVIIFLAVVSVLLVFGVWRYWRKSTIARIAQGLTVLSLVNILFGMWEIAIGGFLLYGTIWVLSFRKMNFVEKIDYETFYRR